MKLVLVRHGQAEGMGVRDADRALTAAGRQQARQTAAWLRGQFADESDVCLLSSPYRRARETAEEIGQVLARTPRLVEQVTPDADARLALVAIADSADAATVVVVTHMPLVASLAAWLEQGVVVAGHGFGLAEARLFEAEILAPSAATLRARFLPDLLL